MHVGLSEFLQDKHDTVSVVRGRPDLVCANFTVLSSADSNLICDRTLEKGPLRALLQNRVIGIQG